MKTIGVLGIQGAIEEHIRMVQHLGHRAIWVKDEATLKAVDGLILPGGESTSMGKQLSWFGLLSPLQSKIIEQKLPVFGTCAGMILLAKDIENSDQYRIGGMDIKVKRNAYGSQIDSFITHLDVKGIDHQVPAVFIRAPRIECADPKVEVLASHEGHAVMVKQENMWAASFHPELTDCADIHALFIQSI